MMSGFIALHRGELMRRCAERLARRGLRPGCFLRGSGIAMFIAQLRRTLEAEERHEARASLRISGAAGGQAASEMAASALQHGRLLLELGFTVDQVVHGYGDICRAMTDLAIEREIAFSASEFRTLRRCLDNAIASAVTAFGHSREPRPGRTQPGGGERDEPRFQAMRDALATASCAAEALELGNLPISGSTGAILKRSLASLRSQLHAQEVAT
jgi:hypothetical protein